MRIGFDISQTGAGKAGCGYVADGLIRAMERLDAPHEYLLYPAVGDLFWDPAWRSATFHPASKHMKRVLHPASFADCGSFWRNPPPGFEERLGNPDLVHVHNFYAPAELRRARLVWTLHDLDFLIHPEWCEEANRVGCFAGALGASLRADLIVSVSDFSRLQFLEIFPHYPEDRIVTVHPASRFDGPRKRPRPAGCGAIEPGSYFLAVGTMQPRKNLVRLVQAWARLRERNPAAPRLVLTGGHGWNEAELEEEIRDRQGLTLTGYVDDDCLAWLYENCFAFLHVALAEGFGLPVLEAMSLGAAVICSGTTSLPEVTGGAALMVNPKRAEEIEAAMSRLLEEGDLQASLRQRSIDRAKGFSWEEAARRTLALYEECLNRQKLSPARPAAAFRKRGAN